MTEDTSASYRLLIADVFELAGASRRSSEVLARRYGQTAARWHVLSVVSDQPRTVAAAARRLGLARQSVQRVVDELVGEGMVALRSNPDHARALLVALTAEGRSTLRSLTRRSDTERRGALARAGTSAVELDGARDVVRRLLGALE